MVDLIALNESDRGRIAAHLLALERDARCRRFLGGVGDTGIQRYVDGLGRPQDVLLGAVQQAKGSALIGLAHAALYQHEGVLSAELGLSVLAGARRAGLGRRLMERAMALVRRLGAHRVVLYFGADNRAMEALARGAGGVGLRSGAVREVAIELQTPRGPGARRLQPRAGPATVCFRASSVLEFS